MQLIEREGGRERGRERGRESQRDRDFPLPNCMIYLTMRQCLWGLTPNQQTQRSILLGNAEPA